MIEINGLKIKQVAACVPATRVDNMDVEGYDTERKEKIIKSSGVRYRRITTSDQCTSDLCVTAANNLLTKSGIDKSQIGLLLFVSQTPDYILPATACVIQQRLGLPLDVLAFDINLGCSGFVYGLHVASALVRNLDKRYALLLAGDALSKYLSPSDTSTLFLFGDCGTATLIALTEENNPLLFSLGSDGSGWRNLIIPAGATRIMHSMDTSEYQTDKEGNSRTQEQLFMDGMEIFNFTISTVVPHIAEVLRSTGEPDAVIFHQANRYMLEFMRKSLKIPKDKFLYSLQDYGNTSSASIPLTLCAAYKHSGLGGKVLMSGFGVGYSWGTVVADLSETKFYDVIELED